MQLEYLIRIGQSGGLHGNSGCAVFAGGNGLDPEGNPAAGGGQEFGADQFDVALGLDLKNAVVESADVTNLIHKADFKPGGIHLGRGDLLVILHHGKPVQVGIPEEGVFRYRLLIQVTTQYNHPSIFIWSIRINESGDDDEFYAKSNEIAHSLDRSRPTTGVRCIKNSHLLEDVYSFNDFIHWTREYKHYRELVLQNQQSVTGLPYKVPYLVTEYCGHIYPVKPFDGEERQLRQAQVHARVQNANYARNDAMGAMLFLEMEADSSTERSLE